MRPLVLTISSWAMLGLAAPASAQPMDTYGMSSRSMALGGAVSADVEDYSANYYNPAGIVRSGELSIGLGWFGAAHEFALDDEPSNVDPASGITFGLNVPGHIGDFRFGFGLGVHLPDQRVSRTRTLPRARPRWELYDNRPQRTYLSTHVAIQPVEWLRIGGGISFLSLSTNRLQLRGILDAGAPSASRVEHSLVAELTTIRYPQVGLQLQPVPWFNFGFVYRGEFALDNGLQAVVGTPDGSGEDPTVIRFGTIMINGFLDLLTQSVNAYVPHQFVWGASVEPADWIRISVDVTWLLWSGYISPLGLSQIQLVIDVPPELEDTIMVPDSFPTQLQQPASFSDRVVPRIGVEMTPYRDADLAFDVRVGYFYENSPVPAQTGFANLVDTDRHAWSLGVGLDLTGLRPLLPGALSFDAHFMYAWLPPRATIKTSLIDPVGDYVAEGHIFSGGATVGVSFE